MYDLTYIIICYYICLCDKISYIYIFTHIYMISDIYIYIYIYDIHMIYIHNIDCLTAFEMNI